MAEESLATPLATYTTAVNFVLGAGVLGLPYAFAKAGILASASALPLASMACRGAAATPSAR